MLFYIPTGEFHFTSLIIIPSKGMKRNREKQNKFEYRCSVINHEARPKVREQLAEYKQQYLSQASLSPIKPGTCYRHIGM